MMRKIRRSLLFIADTTPITSIQDQDTETLIPSPHVCVEIGYAIESKRSEQIVLAQMQRSQLSGEFPFDWQTNYDQQGYSISKIARISYWNELSIF